MITLVAEKGGVVQIAFGPGFLTEAAQKQMMDLWATMLQFMEENDVAMGSPEFRERIALYWEENPKVMTSVNDVADHIEHVIRLVGIDYVGLEDVSAYPILIEELLRRGYGEEDIRKICGENLLRVWAEVERIAQELQQS